MKKNRYNTRKEDRSNSPFEVKKRFCPFSQPGSPSIDYKDTRLLSRYITEKGKIMPSRISFVSTAKQRLLSKAIKKARTLALISHVGKMR